jgi:hypothetical protein
MQASILRNTLLSQAGIERILSLPRDEDVYSSILEILRKFQDIRKFASEIHTEIHLVKPILKFLGYAYESKPAFFEEQVKGPDVALFTTEEERTKSSRLWGTREYYQNTMGILLLKRYGRNLREGITGFYLEFENRIPVYQALYLLRKTKAPWGILTNGKHWILMRRPFQFEERVIEMDVETALAGDTAGLHLFYHIFSLAGVKGVVADAMEAERQELIGLVGRKRVEVEKSIHGLKRKAEICAKIAASYQELFPGQPLPFTEAYLRENNLALTGAIPAEPYNINDYNMGDIFSYLLLKKSHPPVLDLEEIALEGMSGDRSKEDLLSARVLDMTPNFGSMTAQVLETFAYMTFALPYRERNRFVAEWEDEKTLKRHISDHILYGIERLPVSLDILQNTMRSRYNAATGHYKLGNPLLGMSLKDVSPTVETKNQMGLFNKPPKDVVQEFREMYRLYFSLSTRIKEDVQIKNELEVKLKIYGERIRDVMDLMTATYFIKTVDQKRVQEALFSLDSDEPTWRALRNRDWFLLAKDTARKNGFFHLEIEFPFLLNGAFDFIFAQPEMRYVWEEDAPLPEVTKAFIKRGMAYLKPKGRMVVILENPEAELLSELRKSRKFEADVRKGFLVLKRKE